jgi:phospholipid transport system substrate-binding protein
METTMRTLKFVWVVMLGVLLGDAAVAEITIETPTAVIETRATALAEKLQGRQDYYSERHHELYDLVSTLLLPGFDVNYASKLVLGRTHWTAATAEQREAFIAAFYGFLVRTYSKGLIGFDQSALMIDPVATFSKEGDKALVRTSVSLENGDSVKINYALRNNGESGWKMYDVRIDGVSYIQNYRSQFDAEISARGIEAVIKRLESEAVAAAGTDDAT